MKTFLVTAVTLLVVYLLFMPLFQSLAIRSGHHALTQNQLSSAWASADGVDRAKIGFYRDDARSLKDKIARRHLDLAMQLCSRGEYPPALQEFKRIAAADYPQTVTVEGREAEGWCRIDYAKQFLKKENYEGAAEQLARVLASDQKTVRAAAIKQVPVLVKTETDGLLEENQFIVAYNKLGERQQILGARELIPFFNRTIADMDVRAFGVTLDQECQESSHNNTERSLPISSMGKPYSDTKGRFVVRNETSNALQILLRGNESKDVAVAPSKAQDLKIKPGEYLVGVYAPGNCQVTAVRTMWNVDSRIFRNVTFNNG